MNEVKLSDSRSEQEVNNRGEEKEIFGSEKLVRNLTGVLAAV